MLQVTYDLVISLKNIQILNRYNIYLLYLEYLPSVSRSPIPQAKTAYRTNLGTVFILASTSWWSIKVSIPLRFGVACKSEAHVG